METVSLKTLAYKVLQRNSQRNLMETDIENRGNFIRNTILNERIAYKMYSEILQAYLWIVDTDKDLRFLRGEGLSDVCYTKDEASKLKGMDRECLKGIHKIKEVFQESKVEEVIRKDNKGTPTGEK